MGLTERMRRAAELIAWGVRVSDVARAVGVSTRTLDRWRRRPEFQKFLEEADARAQAEMVADIRRAFREAYRRFIEAYLSGVDAPDPETRFKVAKDFLDRVGLAVRQEHQVTGAVHYTYEVILRSVTRESLRQEEKEEQEG